MQEGTQVKRKESTYHENMVFSLIGWALLRGKLFLGIDKAESMDFRHMCVTSMKIQANLS